VSAILRVCMWNVGDLPLLFVNWYAAKLAHNLIAYLTARYCTHRPQQIDVTVSWYVGWTSSSSSTLTSYHCYQTLWVPSIRCATVELSDTWSMTSVPSCHFSPLQNTRYFLNDWSFIQALTSCAFVLWMPGFLQRPKFFLTFMLSNCMSCTTSSFHSALSSGASPPLHGHPK
jgi:hypothetical protein